MSAYPEVLRVRSYRVTRDIECECLMCGWPLYSGDLGFEVDDGEDSLEAGFCSRHCASEWAVETERRMNDVPPDSVDGGSNCLTL